MDTSPNSKQNSRIHATFSKNVHIPLYMWKSIKDQIEALKLDNKKLTKYVQKQNKQKNWHKVQQNSKTCTDKPHTSKTVPFVKDVKTNFKMLPGIHSKERPLFLLFG